MMVAFRNNIMWIVFGATGAVILGLLVAVLADRSRYERFAKALIFMPMAISMVGGAIIWNMMYAVNPSIGMVNAIYTSITGNPPVAWTASQPAVEQPVPDRDHDLAAGRVCHGVVFGGDQRHPVRAARSRPSGRRQRDPGVLPDHDPLHHGHHYHSSNHGDHLHLEDLRRGLGHDRRPVQHPGDRDPVLPGVLHQSERWLRFRHRRSSCCSPWSR